MKKIASFTVNHLVLEPGVYVSRKDKIGAETVTTLDLRMTAPNREPVMNTAEVHTIEHLVATYVRNSSHKDGVIYFGPMGCRTGFYFLTRGIGEADAIALMRDALAFTAAFEEEIPGASAVECGNYLEHDLPGARRAAAAMAAVLQSWTPARLAYENNR